MKKHLPIVLALVAALLYGSARVITQNPSLMYVSTPTGIAAPWAGSAAGVPFVSLTGAAPTGLTAGTGTQAGGVPIGLFTGWTTATCNTAQVANITTGETDLCSYAMPGATLAVNGQKVRITVWGALANNGNTKTYKVYFGAATPVSHATTTANATFQVSMIVLRTGAATQLALDSNSLVAQSQQGNATASPTETLSGPVTIRVTGQSSAASNDVTLLAMFVEWLQ